MRRKMGAEMILAVITPPANVFFLKNYYDETPNDRELFFSE